MKKISIFFILITVVLLTAVPGIAFAETPAATSSANLCLINPVAITTVGNNIFVADNVDEAHNSSVILCFDISTDTPVYKYTYNLANNIVNLSNVNGDLCVILADSIETYTVSDTALTKNESKTYSIQSPVDIIHGKYYFMGQTYETVFCLGGESAKLHFFDPSRNEFKPIADALSAKSCVENNDYVYYLYTDANGNGICKRFDCAYGGLNPSDSFNVSVSYVYGFNPTGLFTYDLGAGELVAVYDSTSIYSLVQTSSSHYAFDKTLFDYTSLSSGETTSKSIEDICSGAHKIFVLNSANEIEIFAYHEETGFVKQEATIGTDIISATKTLPTQFTGFTLAKSNGYPTNIIYRTDDSDTSIPEIIKGNTSEIIILDFEGADDCAFYYVLSGDKFGWVKKSDGATTPEDDAQIEVINTQISTDVTYKAKFKSLNAVTIYGLPVLSSTPVDTFNQTITTAQDAELLQRFVETTPDGSQVEWYYVGYGDGKKGFVLSANVGQFYAITSLESDATIIGDRKINSSLFDAVTIYLTSDLNEDDIICNESGDVLKLYSGDFVKAVREENGSTFVEVTHKDGTKSYGWMPTDNLIGLHRITTNTIVGLSILAAALLITLVFVIVFMHKRKVKGNIE